MKTIYIVKSRLRHKGTKTWSAWNRTIVDSYELAVDYATALQTRWDANVEVDINPASHVQGKADIKQLVKG